MLKRVQFKYRHDDCWLQESTERHESITLVVSSVYMVDDDIHIDLTVHAPETGTIDTLEDEWRSDGRIRDISRIYEGPKGTRFHASYTSEFSVYPHIIHHTPISLGTVRMSRGTEYYDLIGEASDVQELIQVLDEKGRTEIVSAEDLAEVPVSDEERAYPALEELLTDRQIQALILAFSEGYYRWPRDLSASDLAEGMDISVSTLLEHLRQAESHILSAVIEEFREADPARFAAVRSDLPDTE